MIPQFERAIPILRIFDLAKAYRNARPGIVERPWGRRDMEIADPFGNRLVFSERSGGDG
ncbi:MAG TPA: glyoxalase superfamily protein [Falsiroseomonas sp.]|nr:glyoxalase superfamily protein [Falsiroseomonas sp.]